MAHPVHPALVHFPIACWTLGTLTDLAALQYGADVSPELSKLAMVLIIAGLVLAIPTMIAGLLDISHIEKESPAQDVVIQHLTFVLITWCLYGASLFVRLRPIEHAEFISIVLSAGGFVTLGITGWYGAKLVYEHGVGVNKSA